MTVIPPSFRNDITQFADLCEEVARFYGYNNIKSSLLSGKESTQGKKTYKQKMEDVIRVYHDELRTKRFTLCPLQVQRFMTG